MKLLPGQSVFYKGIETYIDIIYDDGTCTIANPKFDIMDSTIFERVKVEYPQKEWLTVNLSELTPKENN